MNFCVVVERHIVNRILDSLLNIVMSYFHVKHLNIFTYNYKSLQV